MPSAGITTDPSDIPSVPIPSNPDFSELPSPPNSRPITTGEDGQQ
jgi:hypothetical protein